MHRNGNKLGQSEILLDRATSWVVGLQHGLFQSTNAIMFVQINY